MATLPQPKYYVYVLARPDGSPFYVGKGTDRRITQHEPEAARGHQCEKCDIIREIWASGQQVQKYKILTTHDEAEAFLAEIEWIALYGKDTLVNQTDGGRGHRGLLVSDEAREQRRSRALAAWANDPERRAKMSAGLRVHFSDPQVRAVHGSRIKARFQMPETQMRRQAVSADPEIQARKSATMKARWEDPEYRARQSAQRQAWWDSHPEARLKRSAETKARNLARGPRKNKHDVTVVEGEPEAVRVPAAQTRVGRH